MLADLDWITLRNMENWIYMYPKLAKLLREPHTRQEIQSLFKNSPKKAINRLLKAGVDHGMIVNDRGFNLYTKYRLTTLGKILLEEYENA